MISSDSFFNNNQVIKYNHNCYSLFPELTSNITIKDEPVAVEVETAAVVSKDKGNNRKSSCKCKSNKIMKSMKLLLKDLTTKTGQQAVVLIATPDDSKRFKVYGTEPLKNIIEEMEKSIMSKLEQISVALEKSPQLFDLPPLIIDGIPTTIHEMTQSQLRKFIPLILSHSTGRRKPSWGKEIRKPPWWPNDIPWANVRMDTRSVDEKKRISWTRALRQIIVNCYKYHGREDLLAQFEKGKDDTREEVDTKDNVKANSVQQGTLLTDNVELSSCTITNLNDVKVEQVMDLGMNSYVQETEIQPMEENNTREILLHLNSEAISNPVQLILENGNLLGEVVATSFFPTDYQTANAHNIS